MANRSSRPDFNEVMALLSERQERLPSRRSHHLPREFYAQTDVAYFVTVCAFERHDEPFRNDALARAVVEALEHRRKLGLWKVYAYCVMPDHLHAVVQLEGSGPQGKPREDALAL
jgi:hypothetical protein